MSAPGFPTDRELFYWIGVNPKAEPMAGSIKLTADELGPWVHKLYRAEWQTVKVTRAGGDVVATVDAMGWWVK